jgi:hypothetical protein
MMFRIFFEQFHQKDLLSFAALLTDSRHKFQRTLLEIVLVRSRPPSSEKPILASERLFAFSGLAYGVGHLLN